MLIKKKVDIEEILDNFSAVANWDALGEKYYIVFADNKRTGQWTLMNYVNNHFSVHGLGENYVDDNETFFEARDKVVSFLWENRSGFNAAVKQMESI
ncbi:hypothetical protein [Paenibacillus sp. GP183]|jgi:hypothetical protein|uniref:hypothetical protein n=1 Tax=Paenibacillus sp. GP183 TaxID=1882751 RepID=UPI000896205F|nr:hypothetical protein [Paenibacillus sp. GP183]SEB82000.1 hypothetical protein SAMN05443246_2015 [Paenibacillus sp. GP183]